MEASINASTGQRTNWAMILRVGVVSVLVLGLVGYAMKVTYESVIKGGVVNRGEFYEVDLKSLSNFDMDPIMGSVADVQPRFRDLDGKKILLKGQVAPGGYSAGSQTDKFQICYSVANCCFGGTMKAQHFVLCRPSNGKTLAAFGPYTEVEVHGTLHIKVIKEAGQVSSIFQMDVDSVDPVS
jgi:hypothetical protein